MPLGSNAVVRSEWSRKGGDVRLAAAAMFALLAWAAPLGAQSLRGTVVLADSVTPGRGAIVQATNERGATVARTLAGDRGEFVLPLVAAGTYQLQVLRIGFKPTLVPPMAVGAGATVSVRVVLNSAAVALNAVNVLAQDQCRVNPDSGLMVARVWDEARKAILTTELESQETPVYAEWIEYDRVLDAAGRVVKAQHVRISRSPTVHAFRSLPAEQLASGGYVVDDTDATMFYAPDAEVLTSGSFASLHCFRLTAPPPGRENLIGVAFQPARDVRTVRDIEGTFWVDRATAELRSLEFQYTNLPAAAYAANPGGVVEFLRLTDGRWFVSRWSVRLPRLGAPGGGPENGRKFTYSASGVVREVHVGGGVVTRVTKRDSVVYASAGNALRVQAVARDTLVRAAGAVLSLAGSDYTASADSAGLITLQPVLEGRYRARLSTPLMDSLGVAPVERDIDVRADAHVDSLTLPSARNLLQKACPADSARHGEAMLRGTVRDEHAQAMRATAVTVTWQDGFVNVNDHLAYNERTLGVLTDNAGRWRFCGVPRNLALTVRVTSDSGSDFRKTILEADQPMGAVDLVVRRGANAAVDRAAARRALVELVVFGTGGAPLAGATLTVTGPGGSPRTVVTGESGRALVADIVPGVLRVSAKRVGFKPGQLAVSVEAGRNTVPILLSDAVMPSLDTVRIVGGKRVSGRLDEFNTRYLRHEATASFNQADIAKVNPVDTWQMLSRVSAMKFIPASANGGLFAVSNRGMEVGRLGGVPCYMAVMVDGVVLVGLPQTVTTPDGTVVVVGDPVDMMQLPPPDQIHGIEVFAGPGSIPPKYNGAGNDKQCGLIAIWTR